MMCGAWAGILAMLLLATAPACCRAEALEEIMQQMDTNKDNKLSFEEVAAQAKVDMPELEDQDKYEVFAKKLDKAFKKADANSDGFVDASEFPTLDKLVSRQAEEL